MAYADLRVDISDGLATLTLDRPEHMNAFSGPMAAALAADGVEFVVDAGTVRSSV